MPIPSNEQDRDAFFRAVAMGNTDAEEYLRLIAKLVYLADSLVDEDLSFQDKQKYTIHIMHIAMCRMPMNPFYIRYSPSLAPLITSVLVAWEQSDNWKVSGDLKQKIFGFVRRENIDGLVVAVAAIVGGLDHARKVTDLIYEVCHDTGETLEDWIAEGRP